MEKRIFLIVFLLIFFAFTQNAVSENIREEKGQIRSICIEGHVFVYNYFSYKAGGAITQVYETQNGKVVPKTCEEK